MGQADEGMLVLNYGTSEDVEFRRKWAEKQCTENGEKNEAKKAA
jgi:hypothetical protein